MQSKAATVDAFLAELEPERRREIEAIRKVFRRHVPKGVEEGMQYGMIGYFIPHRLYPPGYHCDPKQPLPFAGLMAQKHHISMYLACVYMDEAHRAWFTKAWTDAGKRLDMGKGCIRAKRLEDIPLDVVAESFRRMSVDEFIAGYEAARGFPRGSAAKAGAVKRATKASSGAARTAAKKVAKKVAKKPPKR